MKKILLIGIIAAFAVSLAGIVYALTAEEVIEKANQATYYQADDGKSKVNMTITDSMGRTREREMTILRLDGPDLEQKYFVYFHKPSDVKGMTYLVWKHVGKDDDRWLYLPALDLVRRVASTDKRSSFVGSHFAYEEISGRGTEEDNHEIIEETDEYYKIKSTPKNPGSVEFSEYFTWINKTDSIPSKAELYNKEGKLYKTLEALEVKDIDGYKTVTKMKATNHEANGYTVSEFSDIEYDTGLKDSTFTERFLRRPPRKYIK